MAHIKEKIVENTYKYLKIESLYRDVALFALMTNPGKGEKHQKQREAQIAKTLLQFYGDLWDRLLYEEPHIDPFKLSERIGLRMSEYIVDLGGWGHLHKLLFSGQQHDFISTIQSQFRKVVLVGLILHQVLHNKYSMQQALQEYCKESNEKDSFVGRLRNSKRKHVLSITPNTFATTIWKEFKDVAHLWAALNIYSTMEMDFTLAPVIEFDKFASKDRSLGVPTGFAGFCQVAEIYRLKGCSFKAPQSSYPLLNENTSERIAPIAK